MKPNPSSSSYSFNHGPSAREEVELGWSVPPGYPWIDVEIGGGMVILTLKWECGA